VRERERGKHSYLDREIERDGKIENKKEK